MKKFATTLLLILFVTALPAQSTKEVKNDSIRLALSYGAQAFDMLEVYEKLLVNQKAQTAQLGLAYKEAKIQTELLTKKLETIENPGFWRKLWIWTKRIGWTLITLGTGYVIGAAM